MIKGRIRNLTIWEVSHSESEQMTSIDRSRKHEFTGMGELYDRARPSYPPALFRQLDNHFNFKTGETTLEIGCGTGKATKHLAARGLTVTGIDIAPDLLAIAGIRGHGTTVLLVKRMPIWRSRSAIAVTCLRRGGWSRRATQRLYWNNDEVRAAYLGGRKT
jgi:SAM-dependent methyltransferase